MHSINARNLAAALSYLGADVENALLELASVAPSLDAKVRAALFFEAQKPVLRYIADRHAEGLMFIHHVQLKYIRIMHAVDHITRVLDDNDCVKYLKTKFPDINYEVLIGWN